VCIPPDNLIHSEPLLLPNRFSEGLFGMPRKH
jgi:hypothetical protein